MLARLVLPILIPGNLFLMTDSRSPSKQCSLPVLDC